MSEVARAPNAITDTSSASTGIAWGDQIEEERKQHLWASLHAWWTEPYLGAQLGPFVGEQLTGADVFWLAVRALAGLQVNNNGLSDAEHLLRTAADDYSVRHTLNLSLLHLEGVNLGESHLERACLGAAHLEQANIAEAYLEEADLRNAHMERADLHGAYLRRADLREASLLGANLSGAYLNSAYLIGAQLREARLFEADLSDAYLGEVDLAEADLRKASLRRAHLREANLRETNLREADLREADLSRSVCVETNLRGANMTDCAVYGISAWNLDLDDTTVQVNLRITPDTEPRITVDNVELAQFLYLLLHNHKVRSILDTVTSKVVLILGRFGERKPLLDALRERLRHHPNGYIPVLFDFEPQHEKPVLETVKTLANLARFVIADLTDPRMVRTELTAIIPSVPSVPVQPIVEGDSDLPTEYASWALYRSFLPVYRYSDMAQLLANLTETVIAPVEKHVRARRSTEGDRT